MGISSGKKTIIKIASLLGIVQGVIWTILSLVAIKIHISRPNYEDNIFEIESYKRLLEITIFAHFLQDNIPQMDFLIRYNEFFIVMWIYFISHLIWTVTSIVLLLASNRKDQKRLRTLMTVWGTLTLAISIIDFILVCILGRDYAKCGEYVIINNIINTTVLSFSCYTPIGIVMTLAARGFTLWVVNLIFAFTLRNFSRKIPIITYNNNVGSLQHLTNSIPQVPQPNYNRPPPAEQPPNTMMNFRHEVYQGPRVPNTIGNLPYGPNTPTGFNRWPPQPYNRNNSNYY